MNIYVSLLNRRYFTHNAHADVISHFALGGNAVDRLQAEQSATQHHRLAPPAPATSRLVPLIPMLHFIPMKEYPRSKSRPPPTVTTVIHPDAQASVAEVVQPFAAQTTAKQGHSAQLVAKTERLVDGYDVIDINHSAEQSSVAQNSLFQAATDEERRFDAASAAQRESVDQMQSKNEADFGKPIVVGDEVTQPQTSQTEVSIKPALDRTRLGPTPKPSVKQINLQIFPEHNNGQFLHEVTPVSGRFITPTEAPSRLFLKQFFSASSTNAGRVADSKQTTSAGLTHGYETTTTASTPRVEPASIGVSKHVSIKTVLLERESDRAPPSNVVDFSAEPIAYVTTEQTNQPLAESVALSVDGQQQQSGVEIEKQVVVPYHPGDDETNHIEQAPAPHAQLAQIVQGHIDGLSGSKETISPESPVPFPYPIELPAFADRPSPAAQTDEKQVRCTSHTPINSILSFVHSFDAIFC